MPPRAAADARACPVAAVSARGPWRFRSAPPTLPRRGISASHEATRAAPALTLARSAFRHVPLARSRYRIGRKYFDATIMEAHSDGTFSVIYDDGDIEKGVQREKLVSKDNAEDQHVRKQLERKGSTMPQHLSTAKTPRAAAVQAAIKTRAALAKEQRTARSAAISDPEVLLAGGDKSKNKESIVKQRARRQSIATPRPPGAPAAKLRAMRSMGSMDLGAIAEAADSEEGSGEEEVGT